MAPTSAALAPIGVPLNGVSHSGSWDYCVFRAIAFEQPPSALFWRLSTMPTLARTKPLGSDLVAPGGLLQFRHLELCSRQRPGVMKADLLCPLIPTASGSRSDQHPQSGRTMPTVVLDIKTSSALCLDVMRTTLTLDDDVAAALERLRKSRDASLKDLVNEALRRGLKDMGGRTKRRERLRTRSVALGKLRIAGVDNIGESLTIAEGEAHK